MAASFSGVSHAMSGWIRTNPFLFLGGLLILWSVIFIISSGQTQGLPPRTSPEALPSKWDDYLNTLEKQALDEAFKKHIAQLYNIWVTDNYQPKIPPKALTGARNARDAYIRSMEAIEKRGQK